MDYFAGEYKKLSLCKLDHISPKVYPSLCFAGRLYYIIIFRLPGFLQTTFLDYLGSSMIGAKRNNSVALKNI